MSRPIGLFQAYGVELEYMIVDERSLDVRPISDELLFEVAGEYASEVELGEIAWSNELALHVVELKTGAPAESLEPLAEQFQEHVVRINSLLRPLNARLMPSAMHPWMDPDRELQLWPHDYNPVYETFHRIFDCRGHGWANLQSVHLNLPFANDDEFGRLHAAIRVLLPLLPALSASSPVLGRQLTGLLDNRLDVYRGNARRVPSVSGRVIPEPVFTEPAYREQVFGPMFRDIAPHDPEGTLQHEWLNARGAIARFERGTIEIRVLDVQECPAADLAICQAIDRVLRALVAEHWSDGVAQRAQEVEPLAALLWEVVRDGERALIRDPQYLALFGLPPTPLRAGEWWGAVLASVGAPRPEPLDVILREGPLARRILQALDGDTQRLAKVYRELCDCLATGRMFRS